MAGTTHFDLIIGAEITPIEDGHEVSLCALALVPSSACSGGAMAPGLSGADSHTRTCAHVGAGRKPLRAALRGRRKGGHSGRDAAKWEVRIMPSFILESTDRSLGACMLPLIRVVCPRIVDPYSNSPISLQARAVLDHAPRKGRSHTRNRANSAGDLLALSLPAQIHPLSLCVLIKISLRTNACEHTQKDPWNLAFGEDEPVRIYSLTC